MPKVEDKIILVLSHDAAKLFTALMLRELIENSDSPASAFAWQLIARKMMPTLDKMSDLQYAKAMSELVLQTAAMLEAEFSFDPMITAAIKQGYGKLAMES